MGGAGTPSVGWHRSSRAPQALPVPRLLRHPGPEVHRGQRRRLPQGVAQREHGAGDTAGGVCGGGHESGCPLLSPQLQSYSHDLGKEPRRVPRRRQAPPDLGPSRRSARNVRLFLCHFCQDFLEGCYNRLMLLVKVRARGGGGPAPARGSPTLSPPLCAPRTSCCGRRLSSTTRPTTCGPPPSSWPSTAAGVFGPSWFRRRWGSAPSTSSSRTSPPTTRWR